MTRWWKIALRTGASLSLNIKEWKTAWVTDYTNLTPQRISDGKNCLSSTPVENEKIFQYQMCTKWEVHIFNVWTFLMQSLNIKVIKSVGITDYSYQTPPALFG